MKIGIQVEGAPAIGMGHVMRCLALAEELKKGGHKVIFISHSPDSRVKIVERGFKVTPIHENQTVPERAHLLETLRAEQLEGLIVDSYQVNYDDLCAMKKPVNLLIYIDDRNRFVYPVDILINGNFAAEQMGYSKFSSEELLLLGTKYLLIREEFQNLPRVKVSPKVERVLITMGAADPVNFTSRLIQAIRQEQKMDEYIFDIAVGGSNPFFDQVVQLSKNDPRIHIHHNLSRMAELIRRADTAISAGGSTLYELLACGIPTLGVIIVDNQEYVVRKLGASGYIRDLGWHHQIDFSLLWETIKGLSFEERQFIAEKGQNLVDGRGPIRVRGAIEAKF